MVGMMEGYLLCLRKEPSRSTKRKLKLKSLIEATMANFGLLG